MKIAHYLALLSLTFGVASAQPMAFPVPDAPFAPPVAAPDAAPRFVDPTEPGSSRPEPLAPMGAEVAAATPPKDCVRVTLADGSMILGEVSLKAKIGEVEIAMHDIARIDEAFVEEDQFTVTLSNGDRLTGTITVKDVKIKTAWGELLLQAESLASLEAGKLIEESNPHTRRSLDGRTTVTIIKKQFHFQPMVLQNSVQPGTPTYSPYSPTPNTPHGFAPATAVPSARAPRPMVRPGRGTPVAPRLVSPIAH